MISIKLLLISRWSIPTKMLWIAGSTQSPELFAGTMFLRSLRIMSYGSAVIFDIIFLHHLSNGSFNIHRNVTVLWISEGTQLTIFVK